MGYEKIINKISKGAMVKFKNSEKNFYVKNVPSLDSDHVFVTNSDGSSTFRKQLSKLEKINGRDVVVTESTEDKIRKILREYHDLDEYVAKLNIDKDHTYEKLKDFLGSRDERKVGNNTILHKTLDGKIAIKYHRTDIMTISQLDTMTLNTGGWETSTTIGRLNQLLPDNVGIFRKKGIAYIKGANGTFKYVDGMKVTKNGDILH
jgi:hypothetical protein